MNPHSVGASHCRGGQTGKGEGAAQGHGAVLDGQDLSVVTVSHHARLPSCV